jgi:hypothetical protein
MTKKRNNHDFIRIFTTTTTTTITTTTKEEQQDPQNSNSDPQQTAEPNHPLLLLVPLVQSLVQLEKSLTQSLTDIKPLLQDLATPQNMSQVHTILSLARSYSTKTSAPPGWNPNLPVIHFSTPNPLPHQLRQGELGAMELLMAKQERNLKRKRIQEEQMQQKALQESVRRNSQVLQKDRANDPKKREVMDHAQMDNEEAERRREEKRKLLVDKTVNRPGNKTVPTSMNLSDESSSSEEEEQDSDD